MKGRFRHQFVFLGALAAIIGTGVLLSLWRETIAYGGLSIIFVGVFVVNIPRWIRADLINAGRRLAKRDFADARRLAQRFLDRMRRLPWLIPVAGVELPYRSPPVDVTALNILALAQIGQGDLAGARQSVEAAMPLDPVSGHVHYVMGALTMHQDKGEVAAGWFAQAAGLGYPETADDQAARARGDVLEMKDDRVVERADIAPLPAPSGGPFLVRMLNDDKTPMDFVTNALEDIFEMSHIAALRTMLTVDREGGADCGAYDRETAEAKAEAVMAQAREAGHPLQCVVVANPAA